MPATPESFGFIGSTPLSLHALVPSLPPPGSSRMFSVVALSWGLHCPPARMLGRSRSSSCRLGKTEWLFHWSSRKNHGNITIIQLHDTVIYIMALRVFIKKKYFVNWTCSYLKNASFSLVLQSLKTWLKIMWNNL